MSADPTYEEAVVGAMFLEPANAIPIAMRILNEDDFSSLSHRTLFKTLCNMFDENIPIDMTTLHYRTQNIDDIDGMTIAKLGDYVATAKNIDTHARIVKDMSVRKKMQMLSTRLEWQADSGESVSTIITELENELKELHTPDIGSTSIHEMMDEAIEHIQRIQDMGVSGISSGYSELDGMTGGFTPGDLIIVAARPSMGKTALALDMARHISKNHLVGIISLEMSKLQISQRLLCAEARVNSHHIRTGRLSKDEWARITSSMGALSKHRFLINDQSAMKIVDLKTVARKWANEGLECLIVDYLQLLRGPGESRQIEIANISMSLKAIAKELHIPVIALSQLSRNVEHRAAGKPTLADLRESGAIEQDADIVAMIYRPGKYNDMPDDQEALLLIEKHRNGPTGEIRLQFEKEFATFREQMSW